MKPAEDALESGKTAAAGGVGDGVRPPAGVPVLVTGSSGFIGRRLCRRLAATGAHVTGLDLAPGPHTGVVGDVRDPDLVAGCVPERGVVFHLASVVGVVEVLRRPGETFTTCAAGTAAVVRAARRRGARVVLASSSEVYGDGGERRLREEDPLPDSYGAWPRASYPAGKRRAEDIVRAFAAAGGDGRIARLFNVSGPGQDPAKGHVLPTFVAAALAGRPLPLVGGGEDRRSFQHVDDAVAGLLALAFAEGARGAVVNLGGRACLRIAELAQRVGRVLGVAVRCVRVTAEERYGGPAGRARARIPSLLKAERLLGHRPRRSLERIVLDLAAEFARAAPAARTTPCAGSSQDRPERATRARA